jgi:hypothetical protein
LSSLRKDWEEDCRQNRDDRNDDQEFNEGKSNCARWVPCSGRLE